MTDKQQLEQIVRIVPAGKTQDEMLFDVQLPTVPVAGDRIDLEWDDVMYSYLVVSRAFKVLMNSIEEDDEGYGNRLGPVKILLFVEQLSVDTMPKVRRAGAAE